MINLKIYNILLNESNNLKRFERFEQLFDELLTKKVNYYFCNIL